MRISTVTKAGLHLSHLGLSMFFIWLTLGWKVRKARKAFEKELIRAGMSKNAAEKLARKYSSVKDEVMRQLWGSVGSLRLRGM